MVEFSSGDGSSDAEFDIDVEIIRSLSQITEGRPLDFVEHQTPPTGVRRWLRRFNL